MTDKIWSLKKADNEFSKYIRARDGRCMNPRCQRRGDNDVKYMQCSHFWSRDIWPLRFNLDNCDTAHPGCHAYKWENNKQGDYQDYMIAKLGLRKFNKLRKTALDYRHGKITTSHRAEIIKAMKFLKHHVKTKVLRDN